MGKLQDILANAGSGSNLREAWDSTPAAGEFGPLPPGEYIARVDRGELVNVGQKQTAAYKLTFRVIEGDYTDRLTWHDVWLTEAAVPQTKRDLAKLGVESLEQLDQPLPPGIVVRVKLALRNGDDGSTRNRLTSFEVVRIETPEPDPYAPADAEASDAQG